ncbi:MAG: DUF481 domain-containing protein [Verrucomicrobiota bacterium]|nr:DUF481 domain-containing protein [Verrucomicrobiota bacterium]
MIANLHMNVGVTCLALFVLCSAGGRASAQNVVLQLKNGDQISGLIVSGNARQVVISNAWARAISIPLSEISKRETNKIAMASPPAPATAGQAAASPQPTPPAKKIVAAAKSAPKLKVKGTWHGQINLGTSALFGTRDQQDYTGHAQLTYLRPYLNQPKKFFRNTSQLDAEYQRTDGQESANHAYGSNKSDFDLWDRSYAYALAGAGYDDIQKVDFKYQVGPGAGAHLVQHPNFALDTEGGLDYEAQYRRDISNLETFYFRLAEDVTWEIQKNLKLTENVAFYPDMERVGEYHNDFSSTLSYGFWEHLSLNLTVVDHYNTELAPGVDPNQFEVRSSLGFTF